MPNYYPSPINAGGGGGTVTLPIAESDVTSLVSDLALKAPLASPTLTGTPSLPTGTTATTQSAADSTTKLATTAFTTTADNLKANLASPTFTGTVVLPDSTITSAMITDGAILNADVNASAAIAYSKLALTGAIVTGDITDGTILGGDLSSTIAIPSAATATTQSANDTSTKVATTAYADALFDTASATYSGYIGQTMNADGLGAGTGQRTGNIISGTIYVTKLLVRVAAGSATRTIYYQITTAGSSLTSTDNQIAVYNSAGTQLGTTSADQTTPFASTGTKTATVGSFAVTVGQTVFVALLAVFGGTAPQFSGCNTASAVAMNGPLTAANLRAATNGTSQTTLPGSIVPGSNSTTNAQGFWFGLT